MNTIEFNLNFLSYHRKFSIQMQWVQRVIILSVVLFSVVLTYWGSGAIWSMFLALVFGITGLVILIRHPNVGFILAILGGMFIKWTGPSGLNVAALIIAVVVVLWLADMLVVQRAFLLVKSRLLTPILLFLVVSVIAFGMGQIPWFIFANQAPLDAQAGGFAIFILSFGAFLSSAHRIKNIKWLEAIVWVFIGFSGLYIAGRLLGFSFIDEIYHYGLTAGSMFWVWLVTLSLSQVLFNPKLTKFFRWMLLAVTLSTLYVAIIQASHWKSGWIPPLASVMILLCLRYPWMIKFAIPIAIFASGTVVRDLIVSDEYSWGTRIDAWAIVLEISRISPILGLGFSNYYWYTPLFPIRGWRVSFNSHSQYIDLIAQVGIVGLFCFLWIFYEAGRLSWNLSKQLPEGFAQAYVKGTFAGVIGTLVAAFLVDWVLPFVYNIGFVGFRASILPWIFIGGLVSIEQMYLFTSEKGS